MSNESKIPTRSIINTKRLKMFYFAGAFIAIFMPKNYFFRVMSEIFNIIDKRTVFVNQDFYYTII